MTGSIQLSSKVRPALAVIAMMVFANGAAAQHADWVLFGEPDPQGQQLPEERQFVHPVTSPYFHEDSFVTTDVRAWYLYHDLPKSSAIDGGDAQVYAIQARVALTKQLQFVAYKDGYTVLDSGVVEDEGFNDIGAGIKWNMLQDWDHDLHGALGIGYEVPTGDDEVLQDDEELRLWGSINKGFGPLHLGATVNGFITTDKSDGFGNSDYMSWHLHGDYYVCDWFSPVVEVNGYHVVDEGREVVPFQGLDVTNLGGGSGEDVVTIGPAVEFRPLGNVTVRAAYEVPLTKEDDLYGYRWTFSTGISF